MRRFLLCAGLTVTLLASAAAAAPATQSARSTSGPILALAADGDRAAFVVQGRFKECVSVMVWQPQRRRIDSLQLARACETNDRGGARTGAPSVALAGTRAAWRQISGGNTLETILRTASLQSRPPLFIGAGSTNDGVGSFAGKPVGDGTLLAFTLDRRCDSNGAESGRPDTQCPPELETGDIVESMVWKLGGPLRCGGIVTVKTLTCSVVAKADGELTVLAVDAGRIVVRTGSGARVLTSSGRLIRDLPVRPLGAALSGNRLAVRTDSSVEVYDIRSGELTTRLPAASGLRLQDLDQDVLVTATGGTVTLRRLGNGRTSTLQPGRTAYAQLEPSGLFVAGARRVTFMPMRDVLRRLGG
jgi:hypothetical protein